MRRPRRASSVASIRPVNPARPRTAANWRSRSSAAWSGVSDDAIAAIAAIAIDAATRTRGLMAASEDEALTGLVLFGLVALVEFHDRRAADYPDVEHAV